MMDIFTLPEVIAILGEDEAQKALSSFSVQKNLDVEKFIRENAIPYQRHHNARTYLFVGDSFHICGFFSLSLSCLEVPDEISANMKRKMRGFGRSSAKTVPCYLLGQLAREDSAPHDSVSLQSVLDIVLGYLDTIQEAIGGRFLRIDCEDKLIHLYEAYGFKKVYRDDELELNQMIMFIG